MENKRTLRSGISNITGFFEKNILLVVLLILVMFMAFVNANFLTGKNLINILRNMAVNGILSCGFTMLLVAGEFDLSFGSTLGLTCCLIPAMSARFADTALGMTGGTLIGILIALVVSVCIGLVNAYFVIKWRLPSMLVTLATQFAVYGVAGVLTGGAPQYTLPAWFGFFGKGMIASAIPVSVVIFLALMVVFYVLLQHTKYGRTLYVVGGNAEAARLSGINTARFKAGVYIVMQVTAFLAGVIFSSQLAGGMPTYGKGIEFNVIAGVIIGGASMVGGVGNMKNTFIGLLFLNVIMNAMTIANVSEYWQYVVRAVIMILALLLSQAQRIWSNSRKIKAAQALQDQGEPCNII